MGKLVSKLARVRVGSGALGKIREKHLSNGVLLQLQGLLSVGCPSKTILYLKYLVCLCLRETGSDFSRR